MFSKNKTSQLTFIAPNCHVNGEINLDAEALIGGKVEGTLHSSENVEIEHSGVFNGSLECADLKVSGHFNGTLKCSRLIIMNKGTVEGEVCCENMEIYDGGQFIGHRVKESQALIEHKQSAKTEDDKVSSIAS